MAMPPARAPSVFRSPAFTRFYIGQALSYVGDGLRTLAIPLLVFRLTGSALSLGITFALEIVPFALFSVVGGSLADRIARRRLMLTCDAVRFVIMLLFTIAYATHTLTLPLLYVGVVMLAICGAVFLGSQSSSIPYLLGKDRAKAAVAALIATEQSVGLIAPPVGGALFTILGPLPALAINAVTYLTSQISIASVADFGPEEPSGVPSFREIASDIRAGWNFLTNDVALRSLTFCQLAMNTFGIIGFVAMIPYLKHEFNATDLMVGATFGAFALGAVIGSLVGGRTHWPFGRAIVISHIFDAIAWCPTIWTHSLPLAIVAMATSSACATFSVTTLIAWRMRIIPEPMIGRVFGVIRLFVLIGMLPGSLLGGWIADRYGTRMDMLISSIGFAAVVVALINMKSLRRDRR
jgi:MFS family permease